MFGARLRDRVDEAAGGTAELGRVAGRDDLEFLDRLLRDRERRVRPLAAADAAEERLVVVGAVDADVGVDAALAGEGELAAAGIHLHRRRERDEVLEAAAVDRQVSDRFLVNGVVRTVALVSTRGAAAATVMLPARRPPAVRIDRDVAPTVGVPSA